MDAVERSTPYLEMDLDIVEQRFDAFQTAFPSAGIHYAMKCNPNETVLRTLHEQGCGFEIASANELDQLVRIGVEPASVLFSNPVKSTSDIERAANAGVWRFAADSSMEIEKLSRLAPGCSILIRLAAPPSEQNRVASEGKFGIEENRVTELALHAQSVGLAVYGLAFHVGSQMLDPFAWERAIAMAGNAMHALTKHELLITALNVGGGFPVPYEDELVPSIAEFGEIIQKSTDVHLPYAVQIFTEPGRFLVAEAGTMVASVIGVAERHGKRWVHLDLGAFNGMMEALETNNALRFPVTDLRQTNNVVQSHLTGPSCDSQDTILFDIPLSADIAEGDKVHIGCAGAYTTSYASNFNGFEIPTTHPHRSGHFS